MTEYITFDQEALWAEIAEQCASEGVATQESFNEMVDEIVNERLGVGELSPDQNIDRIIESFKQRWPRYQQESGQL
ncbi:MAG: hypothetical protein ACD_76C00106G0028 [uncultured bacterium]|nr:MAG: hypothetical protein ACD_76C00106G0028 [uncultured bacterium]HBD05570.1 hypothetical protein [Candidatus Uhrbacteria bacterium]